MLRSMPIFLILIITAVVLINPYLPISVKVFLYSVSLTIKSLIIFLLPVIIFGLLFKAAVKLSKDATKVITIILASVIFSSYIACMIAYLVGHVVYGFDLSIINPEKASLLLPGQSYIHFFTILPNQYALGIGVLCGVISSYVSPVKSQKIAHVFEIIIHRILKVITFLIPIFITGFIVKMEHEGLMGQILEDYTYIFALIAFSQYSYIVFCYFLIDSFHLKKVTSSLKNMIPAAISGFSTMSSAASMPLTIMGSEKNAHNKELVHTVVPATVNIHLVGDCFATPCFAFAILKSYGMAEPGMMLYVLFVSFFVIAKFSVAAIPGGGILVMLPILERYLGFNSDMLSLITALYILFDPVITSANVFGNGAFAKAIDKVLKRLE